MRLCYIFVLLLTINFYMGNSYFMHNYYYNSLISSFNKYRCNSIDKINPSSLFSRIMNDIELNNDYLLRFNNVVKLYPNNRNILHDLYNTHVCIIGLGGVGSWVVEALARSGINRMTLIDMDDICISNVNRQIMAQTSTIGQFKANALKARILDINPSANIIIDINFVRPDNADELLTNIVNNNLEQSELVVSNSNSNNDSSSTDNIVTKTNIIYNQKYDYIIDAADSVSDKAAIINACVKSNTPIIISGGVGGLVDPTLLTISDLAHVKGDNLLMRVRKKLRQQYGYPMNGKDSGRRLSKKWNIKAIHTLPTGISRGNTKKQVDVDDDDDMQQVNDNKSTCSIQSSTSSNTDTNDDNNNNSISSGSSSLRKCDVSFGNACFATGIVGFMIASCVINDIGGGDNDDDGLLRNTTLKPKKLGYYFNSKLNNYNNNDIKDNQISDSKGNNTILVTDNIHNSDANSNDCCNCSGIHIDSTDIDMIDTRISQKKTIINILDNYNTTVNQDNSMNNLRSIVHLTDNNNNKMNNNTSTITNSIDNYLIDAHCHLQLDPIYTNASDIIEFAIQQNIQHMIICGTCPGKDWDRLEILYQKHPQKITPNFGLHPWWINRYYENKQLLPSDESIQINFNEILHNNKNKAILLDWEIQLEELLITYPLAGIGECGLDKAVTKKDISLFQQGEIFKRHLRLACKYQRAITIHCVSGCWGLLLSILQQYTNNSTTTNNNSNNNNIPSAIVLHSCSTLPIDLLKAFNKIPNIYYSFAGKLQSDKTIKLLTNIPMDKLLIETDSPDQIPTQLKYKNIRKKTITNSDNFISSNSNDQDENNDNDNVLQYNEPALLTYNCILISNILNINYNELVSITSRNTKKAYRL